MLLYTPNTLNKIPYKAIALTIVTCLTRVAVVVVVVVVVVVAWYVADAPIPESPVLCAYSEPALILTLITYKS